jgi:NADP-dependent 3-hydroxy acid dehydrogenase YdfG
MALEYGRRGAHVMAAARREAELASLGDEIRAAGGKSSHMVLDVRDAQAAYDAPRAAAKELGSLDMVIANAGLGAARHASRMELDELVTMIDVNVRGAMATLAGAIPIMLEQKSGQLVGVSSLAGRRALPGGALYSASKAALSTFLEGLRIDLGPAGLGVTDVQPGFVDTPLTKKNDFPMPFLWPADKAARYIANRLERDPRIVAFPFPLTFLSRVSQLLPFAVHSFATRAASGR